MPREYGYISPLLSNLASDYSARAWEGLVGSIIFPRITVAKPSGKYAVFDKEATYKVPGVTMAGERGRANEFWSSGKMKQYATMPYGLKGFIDKADLEMMEGPFRLYQKRIVETLTEKLEFAQELRIAQTIFALSGRSTTLSGTGSGKTNKWGNGGGDPLSAIKDAIAQCFSARIR